MADIGGMEKEQKNKKPKLTDKMDFEEQFKLLKNEISLEKQVKFKLFRDLFNALNHSNFQQKVEAAVCTKILEK